MALSEFEIREVEGIPVVYASGDTAVDQLGPTIGRLLGQVGPAAASQGVQIAGAPFCRYTDWRETSCAIDCGLPVTGSFVDTNTVKAGVLGGPGLHLLFSYFGPYEGLPSAYQTAIAWMKSNDYDWNGDDWNVFITDPTEEPDSSKWQTDTYIPVRKSDA